MNNNGYDPRQEIDLLFEPERISEKKVISASIINQNHTAMWSDLFFILDVPWENFVSMYPEDAATNVTRPDVMISRARQPFVTPSLLIEQTKLSGGNSSYNEVVLTGSKNGSEVRIVGMGIKLTDVGDRVREPLEAPRMRQLAAEFDLPLIELVDYSRIEDGPCEVSYAFPKGKKIVRAVYINRNSYRYCFEGSWDRTKITDTFKGDKNFYGGYNPVSREEYLLLRPWIADQLSTEEERKFLIKLDTRFDFN